MSQIVGSVAYSSSGCALRASGSTPAHCAEVRLLTPPPVLLAIPSVIQS